MRIWLIKTGEPLPVDGDRMRLFRMGILARQLADGGHDVTFWSATFFHQRKTHRARADTTVELDENYRLRLIHSRGYRRNVSLARLWDHRQLERGFAGWARRLEPPDILLSAIPVPGLCRAATRYGREVGVPVVLDVRDLWPDVFLSIAPVALRGLLGAAVAPIRRASREACADAAAILGVTDDYVAWGLEMARREATPLDRSFPMGYPAELPDDDALAEADRFWAGHGLRDDPGAFTACFFGFLGQQFEIEPVLEAARALRDDPGQFRFVFCGAGDNLERYRRAAADLPHVLFPGFVDAVQIRSLMRLSSVGLAPYRGIGNFARNLPNKPIEYMSGGLPIVSSVEGVLSDLLRDEDCGLTYANGDVEELVGILRGLQRDPQRRQRMARNATRLFEQRFVAHKVYGEMIAHLERIAREFRGRA